ncbi:MAG: HAD-IA family hydrolase [Clostridiales bacterium]|nr:HAD-IA family hydrolase [Clostridiales bacterium]
MIKSVIFDMDGVLVDSEAAITVAAIEALRSWNIDAKESDFKPFTGMGEDRFIGGVAEKYGLVYEKSMKDKAYEIYLETAGERVKVYPESKIVLNKLKELALPFALASAADKIKVECNLDCIGIDPKAFAAIVTGSDVVKKKPDPEIFLTAAHEAGFSPKSCLVVEDALSGVQAAKSAGMLCLALTTSFDKNSLLNAGADFVSDNLGELLNIVERRKGNEHK